MNELQIFNYQNHECRIITIDDEPWFIASDVCRILDIRDAYQAIERLDADEKLLRKLYVSGQNRELWLVNEPSLYSLVLTSNKPEAKAFKRWITHEVIPSIMHTGQYSVNNFQIPQQAPKTRLEAMKQMQVILALSMKLEEENAVMAPKAQTYDAFMNADNAIDFLETAKALDTGRGRLIDALKQNKIVFVNLTGSIVPYQQFIDRGYFRVIERVRTNKEGNEIFYSKTLITSKGIEWLDKNKNKLFTMQPINGYNLNVIRNEIEFK